MFPSQYICEEKFRYGSLSDSELVEFVNIFEGNLEKFKIFLKRYYGKYASELRYNIPILYRIAERIDQRKDYYLYFHSDEEDSMYMSQAKEVSLFCYWFIKYKPLSYKSFSDECHFFHDKGYTLNELYGAYVLMSFILGLNKDNCREVKTGKLKSASSKRDVPLNDTAVAMIQDLRAERYMGEDTPLVCDENGDFTRPVNFRKRYYRVLQAAGIETKGLHALRHTFATNLVNGIRQPDGSIKALTPRQVADLLGHTTSQITEMYYVKKDTAKLSGITDDFNI